MQQLDFVLVVVPLTIMVALLTGLVYYLARRDEFSKRKWTVIVQKFLEARSQQQAILRKEFEKAKSQHENGIMDDTNYERLQNVLFMAQEKLRYDALLINEEDGVFNKIGKPPVQ